MVGIEAGDELPEAAGERPEYAHDPHAWQEIPAAPAHAVEHAGDDDHAHSAPLALDSDDRLPWLEGDDEDYQQPVDHHRVAALVSAALLLLAAVVGTIWFATHRHDAAAPVADGSTVGPGDENYKSAPANAGGKTYAGTGATSFAVSRGKSPDEHLAGTPGAKPAEGNAAASGPAGEAAAASAAASDAAGAGANVKPAAAQAAANGGNAGEGGVVQIAAFNTQARAEAAWGQLAASHDVLSGLKHRVVSGQIDSGTVYRLQALTAAGGGGALCEKLHAAGMGCQVKQ